MLREFRRHFGISAPRLRVRAHLALPWRMAVWAIGLGLVAAMIWWGFDLGRILAGFDRSAAERERSQLMREVERLKSENDALQKRLVGLESELQIAKGAQGTLSRQALALQAENTQIKEDLVFLQRLVADAGKEGAPSIQRIQVSRESSDAYRFRVLVVSGGNGGDEFDGKLQLQVSLVQDNGHRTLLTLPEDQPARNLPMTLSFKYYQAVEGSFSVPPGSQVKSVQARLFESGKAAPLATQTLNVIS
jgi:hypothetical protein